MEKNGLLIKGNNANHPSRGTQERRNSKGMSSDGFTWYILNLSIVNDGQYEFILMYQQEYVDFNLGFMMSRSAVSET